MNQPLVLHIDKHEGHYRLQLENLSDETLEDVQVLTVNPRGYDVKMQIKFDSLASLPQKTTAAVLHHVNIVKNHEWAKSEWFTDDMLMCLTDEHSNGVSYDVHVSWLVGGKPGFNQTLKAGSGSGVGI